MIYNINIVFLNVIRKYFKKIAYQMRTIYYLVIIVCTPICSSFVARLDGVYRWIIMFNIISIPQSIEYFLEIVDK